MLEIVGYWTPEYVSRKLEALRAAGLHDFILCIDEARRCSDADFPSHARVLRFRRKVDASRVLEIIER